MIVKKHTTITPITQDKIVSPQAPLWALVSPGLGYSWLPEINGVYKMLLDNDFGVDATNMVLPVMEAILRASPGEKIILKNDTQFDLKFLEDTNTQTKLVHLIETNFEFIKQPGDKINAMKAGNPKTTTITITTSFTPYNNPGKIKPEGCLWYFKNSGQRPAIINNTYLLNSFANFGVDTTNLLAKAVEKNLFDGENINLVSETQFDIDFTQTPTTPGLGLPDQQIVLVETHFKITRQ